VQLTRTGRMALGCGVLALLASAPAARGGVVDPSTGFRFGLFTDSDDVHVRSLIGNWESGFDRQVKASLSWEDETVVVPAVAAPPGTQEAVDAISGASRPISASQGAFTEFRKHRQQIDAAVSRPEGGLNYYRSDEEDYLAQRVGGNVTRSFLQGNLDLFVSGSYGWDDIHPFEDDDAGAPDERKTTAHWAVVATRTATPTTVVQCGVENTRVRGLQHNPYRTVWVDGSYVPEHHPRDRARWDGYVKVNQYLPGRSSVNVSYMRYGDDWGVASQTIGAKLHQYVGKDVVVRYRYRYYTQGEADFWRSAYDDPIPADGFVSDDYRMGAFDAHLFGTRLTWSVDGVPWVEGVRASVKVERYFNSNNFSANIFESECTLSF
jgi:Protein of unknown function (DUF3570)